MLFFYSVRAFHGDGVLRFVYLMQIIQYYAAIYIFLLF
jgi:hypothetical protein